MGLHPFWRFDPFAPSTWHLNDNAFLRGVLTSAWTALCVGMCVYLDALEQERIKRERALIRAEVLAKALEQLLKVVQRIADYCEESGISARSDRMAILPRIHAHAVVALECAERMRRAKAKAREELLTVTLDESVAVVRRFIAYCETCGIPAQIDDANAEQQVHAMALDARATVDVSDFRDARASLGVGWLGSDFYSY